MEQPFVPFGHKRLDWGSISGRLAGAKPPAPYRSERYRSILVPLDGSVFAEHALPHALAIARRMGADVRLVQVHSPLSAADDPGLLAYEGGLNARRRERSQVYLESLAGKIAELSPVRVTPVVMEGHGVVDCLARLAQQAADLVVMAPHPRNRLMRLVRGGPSARLIGRLGVPLLLIPGQKTRPDLATEPAVRHVLTAVDGSPDAETILPHALAVGGPTGAEHTLLRVLDAAANGCARSIGHAPHACEGNFVEALNYIERLVDRYGPRTLPLHGQVICSESSTARVILSHAQVQTADLIALTSRPRSQVFGWLRSSVARDVVRDAHTPVLIYSPAKGGPRMDEDGPT